MNKTSSRNENERNRYLIWLRAGFDSDKGKTQKGLSEALGIAQPQITQLVHGRRGLKVEEVHTVAKYLGISPPSRQYPLVGRVGDDGRMVEIEANEEGSALVDGADDLPFDTVAVEVSGGALGLGFDGWLAFFSQRNEPFSEELLRKLCVVATDDGRVLVKWVRSGAVGHTLHGARGEVEENARLTWAAKVTDLRPFS